MIGAMMVPTKVVIGLKKRNNKAKPCNDRYGTVIGLTMAVMASKRNKTKA